MGESSVSDYDNTNRGGLWKNARKDRDTHPDYTGSINVGGAEFWLSAWLKTARDGSKFMSLSVKPKDGDARPGMSGYASKPDRDADTRAPLDDDIPF